MPHQQIPRFNIIELATWLVGTARVSLSPVETVAQTCDRLATEGSRSGGFGSGSG